MTIDWPQLLWLLFAGADMGIWVTRHGEPRRGEYNAYAAVLSTALVTWILWEGGFFGGVR